MKLIVELAEYAANYVVDSREAIDTARYNFMDTLGCGLLALRYPDCTKHLGPVVPGATLIDGARVPGTAWQLDPVQAAFNIGAMIRWLDFNDTWLAAEWGHPSDNLGGILALADYLSRVEAENRLPWRRADGDDQGARDPGRPRAGEQFQPRRPRPRVAGPRRHRRGRDSDARRQLRSRSSARSRTPGSTAARCAPTATRPTPARANLGGGRRHQPRCASWR